MSIIDGISRRRHYARDKEALYATIDDAKANVCFPAHDPDEDVKASFTLQGGPMEVHFFRVYPRGMRQTAIPIKYGELCSALIGIRLYIDLHQLYQVIDVRVFLYRVRAVRCDIYIDFPIPDPTAASLPAATVQSFEIS